MARNIVGTVNLSEGAAWTFVHSDGTAEPATTAEPGEIVVALIDGVASVRRYEPWMRVLGRVLEVFRRIA